MRIDLDQVKPNLTRFKERLEIDPAFPEDNE